MSKQLTLNDVIKFERLSKCANFWTQVQALAVCGYMMAHVQSKVCVLFCTFSILSVPWWLLPSKDWTWVTPSAFLSIVLYFPWKLTAEDHRPSWYFAYRYGPSQNCCFSKRSHSIFFRLYKDISFHKGKISKVPRLLNWLCLSSIFLPC